LITQGLITKLINGGLRVLKTKTPSPSTGPMFASKLQKSRANQVATHVCKRFERDCVSQILFHWFCVINVLKQSSVCVPCERVCWFFALFVSLKAQIRLFRDGETKTQSQSALLFTRGPQGDAFEPCRGCQWILWQSLEQKPLNYIFDT
jgi:hypothetical protein